jgi:ribosomal protein L14E/L6E/L27E
VAIIVAGKYQGHRVIVIKALPSGLVVVAGMFSICDFVCSVFALLLL